MGRRNSSILQVELALQHVGGDAEHFPDDLVLPHHTFRRPQAHSEDILF
jgi:hypothetical protein